MAAAPSSNLLLRGGAALRGWIILVAGAALLVAVGLWGLLPGENGPDDPMAAAARVALYVAGAMFGAILAAIFSDSGVRAVARYTFVQCLRMKLTGVFIVLIAITLARVYHVQGDGTLGGRIRNFLAYSNGLTSLLVSLMTIFLGISVVTSDVRTKQIFTLATKPLARWEYIAGRWLGVVVLDAVVLLVAGATIYALAQHLRGKAEHMNMSFHDRRAVETEVFTARKRVRPDPLPVDSLVADGLAGLRDQGEYENRVRAFLRQAGGDEKAAAELLKQDIEKRITMEAESLGPMREMVLTFSGIEVESAEVIGAGRVAEINRRARLVRLEVPGGMIGHLVVGAPVKVNGVEARIYRAGRGFMDVRFARDDMSLAKVKSLRSGREVEVVVVSAIQLVYKAQAAGKLKDDQQLRGGWLLINPENGRAQRDPVHDIPRGAVQTFTASAAVVAQDGRMVVRYANLSPVSVLLKRDDIAVLYRVGSFDWNFVRGTALVLFRCAFLAGLAMLAASFLSFPVACLGCLVLYVIALGRGFITDAVKLRSYGDTDLLTLIGHYIMKVMVVLLPDFTRSSPVDSLVDGMYISWGFFGENAVVTVAFRTMLLLALACLIFHRRELARVQV